MKFCTEKKIPLSLYPTTIISWYPHNPYKSFVHVSCFMFGENLEWISEDTHTHTSTYVAKNQANKKKLFYSRKNTNVHKYKLSDYPTESKHKTNKKIQVAAACACQTYQPYFKKKYIFIFLFYFFHFYTI